ncbi:MAG TPA: zinc-ribbon domain-containing protein, partial [Bacillota bacterium]|nr:zinc-ribbon domain-containing protein [Bacillota bacterium]
LTNPTAAAAFMASSTGTAMQTAAANEGGMGAMGAFMGLNMANQTGGGMASNLFAMGQQQPQQPAAPEAGGWTCRCGAVNNGNFCSSCGSKKPEPPAGGFCPECGKPVQPEAKFCSNCGHKMAE